jgi:hypothetical protein
MVFGARGARGGAFFPRARPGDCAGLRSCGRVGARSARIEVGRPGPWPRSASDARCPCFAVCSQSWKGGARETELPVSHRLSRAIDGLGLTPFQGCERSQLVGTGPRSRPALCGAARSAPRPARASRARDQLSVRRECPAACVAPRTILKRAIDRVGREEGPAPCGAPGRDRGRPIQDLFSCSLRLRWASWPGYQDPIFSRTPRRLTMFL